MRSYLLPLLGLAFAQGAYAATPAQQLRDSINSTSIAYHASIKGISCDTLSEGDRIRFENVTRPGHRLLFVQAADMKGDPNTVAYFDDKRKETVIISVMNESTEVSVWSGRLMETYPSVCGAPIIDFEELNLRSILTHGEDGNPVTVTREVLTSAVHADKLDLEKRLRKAGHLSLLNLDLLKVYQDHTGRDYGMFGKKDHLDASFDGRKVIHAGNSSPQEQVRTDKEYRERIDAAHHILKTEAIRHIAERNQFASEIRNGKLKYVQMRR